MILGYFGLFFGSEPGLTRGGLGFCSEIVVLEILIDVLGFEWVSLWHELRFTDGEFEFCAEGALWQSRKVY